MPATDYQGSPLASIGRSILSIRRDQIHSMDPSSAAAATDLEIDSFQRHAADLFSNLLPSSSSGDGGDLLSLSWIRKLLDAFLLCQEEFRAILFRHRSLLLSRPPLDRLVSDFFDRTVKALDLCNAVRDGIDQVRQWHKHLDIALAALDHPSPLGDGQIRRAKKALTDLTLLMLDDKDSSSSAAAGSSSSALNHRNRSFGRCSNTSKTRPAHFRSLSWSVSRSWSAARQLQAIGNNLAAPRTNEVAATGGLAVPVFAMNSVLLFVMWALVAAIPCQDRGLQTHFSIPRSFPWAAPVLALHERIMEESKRRDRRNSNGLLKEIFMIEKCTRNLTELMDGMAAEDKGAEVRERVEELARVCGALKDGLDPLERQVREVFHRIVRSRTEGLDCLSHNGE